MTNKIKIRRIIIILLILAIGIINISCDLYYAEMLGIVNYNLEVNYDNGKVWVSIDGATLPEQSEYKIKEKTKVTITAEEDDGYVFDSWGGDASGTNNPTNITMDSDKSITADFRIIDTSIEYSLDVSSTNGSVKVEVDGTERTGSFPYSITEGASVSLTATADSGYIFDSWSDGLSSTDNPVSFTMNNDKNITANFVVAYTLTVNAINGSVEVSVDGSVISKPYEIEKGTEVTLTATPDTDYVFDYWSEHLSGSTNPATITMDGDKSITANFRWDYNAMVSVPEGTYTQEDTSGNSFVHTISSFKMGKYEVTYDLWHEVYQWATETDGTYTFENAGREGNDGTDGASPTGDKYEPVTEVNWRDVIVWCNAYSEKEGLTPVYEDDSGDVLKDSTNDTDCDNAVPGWTADGYRLPTEGEWQYAASYIDGNSWLSPDNSSGDTSGSNDGDYAWYDDNSDNVTHKVGTKSPNHLGIYDMSGNIVEWCWDWEDDYPSSEQTDYRGSTSSLVRVWRGGSWKYDANYLRVGFRNQDYPSNQHVDVGFRLARRK